MRFEPRYLIMGRRVDADGVSIYRRRVVILRNMKVIADICVVPFTGEVSVRKEVARAHSILKATGLPVNLHGYGTNIEGDYDVIMGALKEIHETLHAEGSARISTTIRLGSRVDKEQSVQDKIDAVQSQL